MPYGISKSEGGDNADNDAFVERLVDHLVSKGHDKISAIKIAKAANSKRKAKE